LHQHGNMEIMPASIKTIAEQCQVSRQAVSNALTGKGRLAPQTRQRILEVAREVGYRPNSIARTMQSGRFGSVALLMGTNGGSNWLPDALLAGIHDELARHDYHLTLARLPDEKLVSEGFVPKLLREWACDGVLINYIYDVPTRLINLIADYKIPSIWLNLRRDADCVHPADVDAAYDATRHLLSLQHRKIAFVDYTSGGAALHYSVQDRRTGYAAAMQQAGCKTHIIENKQAVPPEELIALSRQWLGQTQRPTAVLAYSEAETVSVTQAALSLGLKIPEDLSLLTFHWGGVVLMTMQTHYMYLPEYQMGEAAVQMLLQKIESPSTVLQPRALPCPLMPGQTIVPLHR